VQARKFMGYSAEMTLGKRLAYGDNVEKALTLLQVVQRVN